MFVERFLVYFSIDKKMSWVKFDKFILQSRLDYLG